MLAVIRRVCCLSLWLAPVLLTGCQFDTPHGSQLVWADRNTTGDPAIIFESVRRDVYRREPPPHVVPDQTVRRFNSDSLMFGTEPALAVTGPEAAHEFSPAPLSGPRSLDSIAPRDPGHAPAPLPPQFGPQFSAPPEAPPAAPPAPSAPANRPLNGPATPSVTDELHQAMFRTSESSPGNAPARPQPGRAPTGAWLFQH